MAAVAVSLIFAAIAIGFTTPFLGIFTEDAAVLLPVKVLNMILGGGIIRSGGRTKYIMIIDTLGTWLVGAPLALLTGLVLKLPIVWVYFILSQEELVRFIISVFMFRSRKWMNTIE